MTDVPTVPGGAPAPPRRAGGVQPWVVGASLVFLIASGGLLWWVLGDTEPSSDRVETSATAAPIQPPGSTEPPDTTELGGTEVSEDLPDGDDDPSVSLPEPSVTVAPAPTTLRQVGPLTPTSVSVSNTREMTPKLACTGGSISYVGDQLIDGTDLGWGPDSTDGAGQFADFSFDTPVHLSTVGLTPGYLRQARRPSNRCQPSSSFPVNRFVDAVEWSFDDGSSVVQRFDQRPEMQLTPADVTTANVRMTILETTRPVGADDDTVISEANFTGSEAP